MQPATCHVNTTIIVLDMPIEDTHVHLKLKHTHSHITSITVILFGAPVVPTAANGSPFKLATVSF